MRNLIIEGKMPFRICANKLADIFNIEYSKRESKDGNPIYEGENGTIKLKAKPNRKAGEIEIYNNTTSPYCEIYPYDDHISVATHFKPVLLEGAEPHSHKGTNDVYYYKKSFENVNDFYNFIEQVKNQSSQNNKILESGLSLQNIKDEFRNYKHPKYNTMIVDFSINGDFVKVWHYSDFKGSKLFQPETVSNRSEQESKALEESDHKRYHYYMVPIKRWQEARQELHNILDGKDIEKELKNLYSILCDIFPDDEEYSVNKKENDAQGYEVQYKGTPVIETRYNQGMISLFVLATFLEKTELINDYEVGMIGNFNYINIKVDDLEDVCDQLKAVIEH